MAESTITQNTYLKSLPYLPSLEFVGGNWRISENLNMQTIESSIRHIAALDFHDNGSGTATVSFPNLRTIGLCEGCEIDSHFQSLAEVSLSAVETIRVGAEFTLFHLNSFHSLRLPSLRTIDGGSRVYSNSMLDNFDLARLETVGDLTIQDNRKLVNFTANALKKAFSIFLGGPFTNVELVSPEEVVTFSVSGDESMEAEVGVGTATGVLALVGVSAWLWVWRQRRRVSRPNSSPPSGLTIGRELDATETLDR
ncbi:hypothetical protein B0H67DRAFT_129134 [Lasiosphaeris hirsuta]|uniref:Uncharacterized protein n=1 Tax=Lasiosphaeris hirsuta TaxID=260670 RepID=A0AA40E527_9PEZI|nr:hypothetical protein B0H67DRAFT_129134 [Lasiosphaeris hirsuta]